MNKKLKWLLKFASTGIASPLLILLMIRLKMEFMLVFFAPVFLFGIPLSSLMEKLFPPQGGGWFVGVGQAILVDLVLACIYLWIVLMFFVKFVEFLIRKRKEKA
jgi:hypothetical protein